MKTDDKKDPFPRMLWALFAAFVVLTLAAGYWYYRTETDKIRDDGYSRLKAIARLKADQIVSWRDNALDMAGILAKSPFFNEAVQRFRQNPGDESLARQILERMRIVSDATGCQDVMIVNAEGETLLSIASPSGLLTRSELKKLSEALEHGHLLTSKLFRCGLCNEIHLDVIAPLPGPGEETALVYRLNPEKRLFALLSYWPVFRKSAETLLVRRDGDSVLFLNNLNFDPQAALSLRIPLSAINVPAVQAVMGREGLFEGVDYRGKKVLSDIHRIPGSDWYMIAKVDESEIVAEARYRSGVIVVIGVLLIALAGIGSAFLFNIRQKNLYEDLYRSELEKKRLQGYLDMVARYATDIILVADQDLNFLEANEAACRAYQYGIEDLRKMTVYDIRAPEARELVDDQVASVFRSGGQTYETMHRRKDGSTFPIELAVRPMELDGKRYLHAIGRDLTERKAVEARLREAGKMEAVGRLAGGVAHDFNNMLAVIIGYTEMAITQVGRKSPLHQDLQEILKAAQRSADLTTQLLAFARKQPLSPRILSLNDAIAGNMGSFEEMAGESVRLSFRPGADLWKVRMDASQVTALLASLVKNACESIEGSGTVELRTENVEMGPEQAAEQGLPASGDYVRLEVSDTGRGIPEELLPKIFEPFFTTKDVGEGSGMGLATVYGIITQSRGGIRVDSRAGRGTTAIVHLPRSGEAAPARPPVPLQVPPHVPDALTVLVVEDEAQVLAMTESILSAQGFRVLSATSGESALALARSFSGSIDLLITDVVMPGRNGWELAGRMSEEHPGIKVVYMSGYTRNAVAKEGVLEEGVHFLRKPFSMSQLLNVIQEALKG